MELSPNSQFKTPEEEIKFLREQVTRHEDALREATGSANREKITEDVVKEYAKTPVEKVLPVERITPEASHDAIVLALKPETHDKQIEELLGVLLDQGIKNALSLLEKMNNPHLDDDFHRFLVQYIHSVGPIPGDTEGGPLWKPLRMTLFEIAIPENENKEQKSTKEFLGAMEQFLAGMQSIGTDNKNAGREYFVIELAKASGSTSVVIYVAVPNEKIDLFEKQILSFYHGTKVRAVTDDYNIFIDGSVAAAMTAKLSREPIYPIKTYDQMEQDPMNTLLNVFSKLGKDGEGAAMQIVVSPVGEKEDKKFSVILESLRKGKSLKEAMLPYAGFDKQLIDIGKGFFSSKKESDEKKTDDGAIAKLTEKLKSSTLHTSIKIVASAGTSVRAEQILSEVASSFNQFNDPTGNQLIFEKVPEKKIASVLHDFSYRLYDDEKSLALNFRELASVFHFPMGLVSNPLLRQSTAASAPAPLDTAADGILLGTNLHRAVKTEVRMGREDRMRHFYVIGQTGTGKTNMLKVMAAQDIANGDGCCFIDPHGTDVQDLLSYVPKERIDDVIYFDPAYTARPMGLNMLEFDPRFPEQKTMVIDTLMTMFDQLFNLKASGAGGPLFEQYFKNSTLLVMEHPESGATLLEVVRVMSDKAFRDMKLSHCKNPIITNFWKSAEATTGDQGLQNFVPYITSKFDPLISNEFMRPIVLQEKSVLNMRDIMDNKKILLVNLSKGRLGDINANLIGMILVMKFQMAALSRVDSYGQKLQDFYLYIDEFQNVTTPAISSILSEARKYRLSLNIAHQYIGQLPEDIKGAVFGNVGSMAIFRISPEDAKFMEAKFAPTFSAADISKIENYNAYVSMLVRGTPVKPFNIAVPPPPKGNKDMVQNLKELSYLTYGRDRAEVETEVFAKFERAQ